MRIEIYDYTLGEMDPDELAETALNPGTRKIIRITNRDAEETEESLNKCMGTDVNIRRQFIEDNAHLVDNPFDI